MQNLDQKLITKFGPFLKHENKTISNSYLCFCMLNRIQKAIWIHVTQLNVQFSWQIWAYILVMLQKCCLLMAEKCCCIKFQQCTQCNELLGCGTTWSYRNLILNHIYQTAYNTISLFLFQTFYQKVNKQRKLIKSVSWEYS